MKNSKRIPSSRKGCSDLSLIQTQDIFRMRKVGRTMREIAKAVGCSASTVSDYLNHEVLRKHHKRLPWYEKGKLVFEAKRKNRGAPRTRRFGLKEDEELRKYVVDNLKDKLSPKSISFKIRDNLEGKSLSHEAIYLYIYHHDRDLIQYLIRASKTKRNNRASPQKSRLREAEIIKKNISQRSEAANSREELGHIESDFMVSCRGGKSCLLVAADRKARRIRLKKTLNREADTTRRTLFQIFRDEPSSTVNSLTVDNDPAHNHLPMLEKIFSLEELEVFFCDAYSPWQRGTVEAIIGILRRWFPKGTNFDEISDEQVQYVEDWFNNRPMEVLNGKTPNQVFQEELEKLRKAA